MNTPQYRYEQQQQKKAAEAINVAQIVKVTAYDGAKQTVDVQPISKRLEQGTYQSQPPILGVPIVCDRGGGFAKKVAYKAGDIGLVVFCDHDIDNAVSSGTEGEPNTERNHSATDAIFIGGILPVAAEKLHVDPAVMASPLITTIVDTTTLLVYFNIAKALLHL